MKWTLSVAVLLLISACGLGDEEAQEFTDFNRDGFLAACTQTGEDIELSAEVSDIDPSKVSDICECVWDTTESEMSFEEFASLDDILTEDSSVSLPVGVSSTIADCVISELNL